MIAFASNNRSADAFNIKQLFNVKILRQISDGFNDNNSAFSSLKVYICIFNDCWFSVQGLLNSTEADGTIQSLLTTGDRFLNAVESLKDNEFIQQVGYSDVIVDYNLGLDSCE